MRSTLNSAAIVAAIGGTLAIVFVAATAYRDMTLEEEAVTEIAGSNTGAVMTDQSGGTAVVETPPRVEPDTSAAAAPNGDDTSEDSANAVADAADASDLTEEAEIPDIPDLDVVRVEPSGDAVLAGRVEPGWTVELRNGQETVASTTADANGEWVIVLDEPLPAGASELTLHGASPNGDREVHAPDSVTVVVDANRTETPLVVVSDPDSPSTVLQTPQAPQIAAVDEEANSSQVAASSSETSDDTNAASSDVSQAEEADPETDIAEATETDGAAIDEPIVSESAESSPDENPAVADSSGVASGELVEESLAGSEPLIAATGDEGISGDASANAADALDVLPAPKPQDLLVASQTDPTNADTESLAGNGDDANDLTADESAAPQETELAAVTAPDEANTDAATSSTLGSSDSDGSANLQDQVEPETAIETVRPEPDEGAEVQTEQAALGSGAVSVPAENTPAQETLATDPPLAGEPPIAGEPEIVLEPPLETEELNVEREELAVESRGEAEQVTLPQVAIETVETSDEGALFVTGRAEPGEQVRAYGNNEELGVGVADETGRWTVRSEVETGSDRDLTIRADAINVTNGAAKSRVEVTFSRPEPGETVVALMPVPTSRAQSDDESFDRLIVRQGDNLWTIARQIYGQGVRFTTIYQANANQIGDPDLIYPGQVFAIPKGIISN